MRVVMIGWCSEGRSLNLPHMVVIAREVYDCDNLCCILSFFLCVSERIEVFYGTVYM